jgi:hypothetical protein
MIISLGFMPDSMSGLIFACLDLGLTITCRCSHTFILAESSMSPV